MLLSHIPSGHWPDLALIGFFWLLLMRSRVSVTGFWFLSLPGTIAHELAHFSCALFLNGKPDSLTLTPEKTEDGYRLGSVSFHPRWYNGAFVALAPGILLPVAAFYLTFSVMPGAPVLLHLPYAYLVATLLLGALPSMADWMIVFQYPLGMLVLGGIGWFFWA